MITGKDKERVRALKLHADISKALFESIKQDFEGVMEALERDGINVVGDEKYCKIPYDIGRCIGMIDILNQ